MSRIEISIVIWIACLLLLGCVNTSIIEESEKTVSTPVVHNETIEPTSIATIAPPSAFMLYRLPDSNIGVYIPGDWVVTGEISGEFAILQSYPEDKYIGGEGRQPGDTKCDMRIKPGETDFEDLVQEVRSSPNSTIISEDEVVLNSGYKATRFEINSLGQSLFLIADIEGEVVSLVCFGNLSVFDQIAFTLTSIK